MKKFIQIIWYLKYCDDIYKQISQCCGYTDLFVFGEKINS